jgi:hypothetical protein
MKINAKSIDELFGKSNELESLFREIDEIITDTVPKMERTLFESPSITMIAYGIMPYKTTKTESEWPVISLAPQKGSVNLYIMGLTCGAPIAEVYKDKLGKVSAGKSCIRIKNLKNINIIEMKNMLRDAERWFLDNPNGNKG